MKDLDMNRIIAWGLIIMGILSVGGWIAFAVLSGTSSGTEIPIAISSGLIGVLTGKNLPKDEGNNPKKEGDKK